MKKAKLSCLKSAAGGTTGRRATKLPTCLIFSPYGMGCIGIEFAADFAMYTARC